jgi:hypothetical protein
MATYEETVKKQEEGDFIPYKAFLLDIKPHRRSAWATPAAD